MSLQLPIIPNLEEPLKTLTVGATAVQFPAFNPLTKHVLITVEAAEVRVRIDGVDPTTNTGHLLRQDEPLVWPVGLARHARFIRASGSDATIHASGLKF